MKDVPNSVIQAAKEVSKWCEENNIKNWIIDGCASRTKTETLRSRSAELEKQEPTFYVPVVSPYVEKNLGWEIATLKSHNKRIMDMCVEYSDENQSLKAELADALDCKLGNGPTALTMVIAERDSLKAELAKATSKLEAARKDAERALKIEERASRNCEHARLLKKAEAREIKLTRMLDKAVNNNGWISIFDGMPNDGQQVLVWEDLTLYGQPKADFKGFVLYYWRDGIGWVANAGDDDAYPMICITHWKPLPAPPAIEQAKSCNELHEKGAV